MTEDKTNKWKPCLYYDEEHATTISLTLPNAFSELEFEDLSDIFSLEVWNALSEDERTKLRVNGIEFRSFGLSAVLIHDIDCLCPMFMVVAISPLC
jgi:hypothetical protein